LKHGPTDGPTDIVTDKAAIAAKKIFQKRLQELNLHLTASDIEQFRSTMLFLSYQRGGYLHKLIEI
jgi:hypothetical protein